MAAPDDHVEGRNAVTELLASGRRILRMFVLDSAKADDPLGRILVSARSRGIRVDLASRRDLDAMSERGAHQGVVAVVEPFHYSTLDEVLSTAADRVSSLVVVLDHVTDPQNLGAVVRTAEVVGADGVIIPKDRAAAMTPSALKASAGAAEHIHVCREANIAQSLARLKGAGYWVAGASEKAKTEAWDAPLEGRIALVMGAEGSGLARLTERECDVLVRLPVRGRVSSLNVSAATAVLSYEWLRRNRG
ncbi:MAG TPA: 23S rRNA (guanosine(2251)-2'-O)-methyltransferase RlmB [Coriobacteriia bacterium]